MRFRFLSTRQNVAFYIMLVGGIALCVIGAFVPGVYALIAPGAALISGAVGMYSGAYANYSPPEDEPLLVEFEDEPDEMPISEPKDSDSYDIAPETTPEIEEILEKIRRCPRLH